MPQVKTSYDEQTHLIWGTEYTCKIKDFTTGQEFFGKGKTIEEATENAKRIYFNSPSYKEYRIVVVKRAFGRILLVLGCILCVAAFYFWKTGNSATSPLVYLLFMVAGVLSFYKGIILLLKYY